MRKPKGKLVALLAGAVVVVLVVVSWQDIYCHLFLHPELVGRWRSDKDHDLFLQFDRIGRLQMTWASEQMNVTETYSIHGSTFGCLSHEVPYRITRGNILTFPSGETYRRVPDGW